MSVLDMLHSQYGDGNYSNQQETLQRLNAMQQWQNPMMQQQQQQEQQKRSYGPWDAIGQIAAAYARNQGQSQQQPQMPQPAPQMDVGNGVSSVLENLMQSHGSDSLFRGW